MMTTPLTKAETQTLMSALASTSTRARRHADRFNPGQNCAMRTFANDLDALRTRLRDGASVTLDVDWIDAPYTAPDGL